jgi:hypothetical protein
VPNSPLAQELTPTQQSIPRSTSILVLILILGVAAFVRLFSISANSIWTDELFSMEFSCGWGNFRANLPRDVLLANLPAPTRLAFARPITQIPRAMLSDTHPPLYFVILRVWRDIFGEGEVAARALSAVASLAAVVMLYLTVRITSGESAALWSAALLAVAGSQVEFAQEARSYSMLLALVLACCCATVRIEKFGATRSRCILLGALVTLTMLTHYYAAPALAAIAVYGIARLRGRYRLVFLCALGIAAVIFIVAWGPFLWQQRANFSTNMQWTLDPDPHGSVGRRFLDAAQIPGRHLIAAFSDDTRRATPLALLYLLPAFFVRRHRAILLWWLIALFSISTVLLTDLIRGSEMIQWLRYTVPASAAFCAMLILMIHTAPARWKHWLCASLCLMTAALLWHAYDLIRPDFRGMADSISLEMSKDDALVILEPDKEPWYSDVLYMAVTQYARELPARAAVLTHPPDELMQKSLASSRYIWMISGDGRDPRPYLPEARLVLAREFPHVAIVYKVRLPAGP